MLPYIEEEGCAGSVGRSVDIVHLVQRVPLPNLRGRLATVRDRVTTLPERIQSASISCGDVEGVQAKQARHP